MARNVPRPFAFSWGSGQIIEEAAIEAEWSNPAIQLLRYEGGDHDGMESIRFCHFSDRGGFQRSPMMMGAADVAAMREALQSTPRLRSLLADLVKD
ncbi:MAG: hypothetical protein QOG03_226 [Actinomycetota bacterium]|jgi:hypothetical protein|nr:hypothetical protein [Actinomycetota bacterium]